MTFEWFLEQYYNTGHMHLITAVQVYYINAFELQMYVNWLFTTHWVNWLVQDMIKYL